MSIYHIYLLSKMLQDPTTESCPLKGIMTAQPYKLFLSKYVIYFVAFLGSRDSKYLLLALWYLLEI